MMNSQLIDTNAQKNLMGALLTYPNRAAQILDKHQHLLNDTFVECLEEMAQKMEERGNQGASDYLRGLIQQIRRDFFNVIAKVGQETIKASEILSRLTRYQLLPQFLSEIMIDQAIADIPYTEEEKQIALQMFIRENNIHNEEEHWAWCRHNGLTMQQFEELALRPLKIHKFQEKTFAHQVEAYFLTRKDELDQVSYSLLRLKNGGLAQELYFRLEEGEQSFAELARQYSQGPEAQTGGLVGPMPMTMPHPLIAQKLKTSQPGQILPPIQLEEWFIIVRLERFIPAKLDDNMKGRLINELFQNWLSEQLNKQPVELLMADQVSPSPMANPQLVGQAN